MLTNFINGRFVDSHSSQTTSLIDPVTEREYEQAVISTPQDVDDALKVAESAFADWSKTTPAMRQMALLKIADELERRASEFIDAEIKDTGKPVGATTDEEFPMAVDHLRFFAGAVRVPEGLATDSYLPELTSSIRREPLGVIAQVSPWNFPLLMAIWKIAPAIGTGNTVVLKPAEDTPTTTLMLAELAQEFLPPGVFNVVLGGRETGAALTQHPIPTMVAITGSVRAGREVALAAADSHKQTHLELGGNAPVVVFADADLDAAAEMIVASAYSNGGQDCTAAARILIHDSVHDDLLTKIVAQASEMKTGRPDEDVAYGPLINADHFSRVQSLIDNLPEHARIETGGHRQGEEGYFIAPTVISGVGQDDEIVQQEIFGPVMTVQKFTDETTAIHMANDTEYGLASSVWTTDHARALRMSRALNFGCVWLNTHLYLAGEMPHGGFGASGHGKDMSRYSLEAYTRIKHVMSFTPDVVEGT